VTRQDLGAAPSGPYDVTTVSWVTDTYPSTGLSVSTGENYTAVLPSHPIDHSMFLLEVVATANIVVSVPDTVLLTEGVAPYQTVFTGKSAFFGFRYSATQDSWFLLSNTLQV
jgi:hypothetical protein